VSRPPLAPRLAGLTRPATAWALLVIGLATYVAFGIIFYSPITPRAFLQNGGQLAGFWVFPLASFAIVGALIAIRRPSNGIGWLLLGASAAMGLSVLCSLVGSLLTNVHQSAGAYILLLSSYFGGSTAPALGALFIALLIFPDGRVLSVRWRFVVRALLILMAAGWLLDLVNPTRGNLGVSSSDVSVLAIPALANQMNTINLVYNLAIYTIGLAAVVSLFLRLRGADPDRRHQIRWVAYAGGLSLVIFITSSVLPGNPSPLVTGFLAVAVTVAGLAVPTAIAIAVLKYRLYDIDVIISRTLVYGTLALLITALYVGMAVGIGTLVGSGGKPNLGLSILATGIVAVGFQPLRDRLRRVANRLVYGKRATPYEALSDFSRRAAETYAADDVLLQMALLLQQGTGAETATVWLRAGEQLRPAATYPENSHAAQPLQLSGQELPALNGGDRLVGVQHQGELLGALSVTKRRGESLTPIEEKLLDDLAHQAGLVLKNVSLTATLLQRLDELRASRQRLVTAQDEERRRLERNLHDGAQQHLIALKIKATLAETQMQKDPDSARTTIAQIKSDADEALGTLRDLARGIYPPLLADSGLVVALESHARKGSVPIVVEADHIARYPQELEAAVYFCVLEALQNVQKYAGASKATVRLREIDSTLCFEVEDDGSGFDVITAKRGAGTTNMIDRLDALGGALILVSDPGHGARVSGTLPFLPSPFTGQDQGGGAA
jgi:signal transduction histidine kinase